MTERRGPNLEHFYHQLPARNDWIGDANCRGLNPDLFLPVKNDVGMVKAALKVCAGCSVRQPCLELALTMGSHSAPGIWGGTTVRERERIRRNRKRAA